MRCTQILPSTSMWGEIVEAPWGMNELYVFDPSGSLVKFGQPTDRFISADAVQEAPSD